MITEPRAREFIRLAQRGRSSVDQTSTTGFGRNGGEMLAKDEGEQRVLNERQWIASYLVIHLIADDEDDQYLLPPQ